MKKLQVLQLLWFKCLALIFSLNTIAQSTTDSLIILHTNDLHSRLMGYGPESEYTPLVTENDSTVGGFARMAAVKKKEKDTNTDRLLMVDAGDFLMGTFFHALEPSTGFQLNLMKKMGYDVVALGNHEFDFGPATLAQIINSALQNDGIPQLILTNIQFDTKSPEDDALEKLFEREIIKRYHIVQKNGLKIGLLGIMGYDASEVAPNAKPVKFTNPVKETKRWAKKLKKDEGVDIVIVLSHSGITLDKNGKWRGEDYTLASKIRDIDLIISGHTHTYLNDPLMVNKTAIVQTGSYGENIGRSVLTLRDKNIIRTDYHPLKINDKIMGDNEIQQMIIAQQQKISDELLEQLDIKYNQVLVETSFGLRCDEYSNTGTLMLRESNLGPLIADAIFQYVNTYEEKGTDVAMIASGMIRDNIHPGITGYQTAADLFRVVSLGEGNDNLPGYPLSRVYVNGKELKNILEILLVAHQSSTSNYIYYSGIKIYMNPTKGLLRKVEGIELLNESGPYKAIDLSKKNTELYSIVADAYMLEFIGIIKKMSFGLMNVKPRDEQGIPLGDMQEAVIDFDKNKPGIQEGKQWISLVDMVRNFDDANKNGIPDIPEEYREKRNPVFDIEE